MKIVPSILLLRSSFLNFLYGFLLMPSSHCAILGRFFTRRQVLINRWQMHRHRKKLWASSREWQSRSVNYQRRDLRSDHRRCVADTWKIFAMLNIWSYRDSHSCCVNEFWLKNTSVMTPTPNERPIIQGSWKLGETFIFDLLTITVSHYKTTCIHLALEYKDQVDYGKMKKGIGFFL